MDSRRCGGIFVWDVGLFLFCFGLGVWDFHGVIGLRGRVLIVIIEERSDSR
jgi:hypothetical protein